VNNIPFIKSTGSVYGIPYKIIQYPEDHSYKNQEFLRPINLWCWDTFGQRGEVYDGPGIPHRWYYQRNVFWFRDERDYEWFILRWQ
jgi:hypothetical protein